MRAVNQLMQAGFVTIQLRMVAAFVCGALGLVPGTAIAQLGAGFQFAPRSQSPQSTEVSARALQGLEIAMRAAEHGLIGVSVEAVRRSVGKGPPIAALRLGGLLSGGLHSTPLH